MKPATDTKRPPATRTRLVLTLSVIVTCLLALAGSAHAAQAWRIDSLSDASVAPGGEFEYLVQMTNVGDADMDGSEIDLTGSLPVGMTAVDARLILDPPEDALESGFIACTAGDGVSSIVGASDVRCVNATAVPSAQHLGLLSYQLLRLIVRVDPAAAGTLTSSFTVVGGGAPAADTVDPIRVARSPPMFGIDAFDGQVLDAAGNPFTQAGGHPDTASVSIDFNTHTNPVPTAGSAWPVEPVKDVIVDLPPGLVGDPTVVDKCTATQLANSEGLLSKPLCPATSQVGTTLLKADLAPIGSPVRGPIPLYNMVPPPNVPARFGFNELGTVVVMDATLRSGGDYGLTVSVRKIPAALPVAGTTVTFWGVPAAPSHDSERACPGMLAPFTSGPSCGSGAAQLAFLRNPTSCPSPGVGLATVVHADSWTHPDVFDSARWISHLAPFYPAPPEGWGPQQGPTACDRVPFDPTLEGQPQATKPNTPSAFAFDLSLPQTNDPVLIGESDLRTAVVTLPEGVRVSPSAADGLQACSAVQIHLHDANAPDCPERAKVGTATITTPLLRESIQGAIYLATPRDNPFGTLLAIYLVAEGQGVVIKLAGRVEADPLTGQLTATFDDNPQTPFTNLHLEFDGGPRAQLVTPKQCGTFTTRAVLTGWNGRTIESDSRFTITGDGNGAPCSAPRFSPSLSAGTASNSAGSSSSFLLRFTRDDADQDLKTVTVSMPGGLTGKIATVPLCSEIAARGGSCPESSKIGDVTVGAGAGSNPFYITNGRAYLTGPYKSAPFGLSIVVPAVAGPFDLGDVVVRSSIFVDKHTAELRVVSDPLPSILQGIPLDVRDVRVNVNKRDFFLNPTSCAKKTISGVLQSTEGRSANVSSRFQAADCAGLAFKPRMVLSVGGQGHTARNRSTPFSTTLTMPQKGQANLSFVRVTLPQTINARLTVINDACTRAEFEADINKCKHAQAGSATAVTPLLRDPLRGGVYFVKNGRPLPDLFIALRGQVAFDLVGRVTIPGSKRLRTTFDAVPDVPVRSFTLRLFGDAKNGSVGAAANLCSAKSRKAKAELDYIGQNGKVSQVDQALKVNGCAKHRASSHHRRH